METFPNTFFGTVKIYFAGYLFANANILNYTVHLLLTVILTFVKTTKIAVKTKLQKCVLQIFFAAFYNFLNFFKFLQIFLNFIIIIDIFIVIIIIFYI